MCVVFEYDVVWFCYCVVVYYYVVGQDQVDLIVGLCLVQVQ